MKKGFLIFTVLLALLTSPNAFSHDISGSYIFLSIYEKSGIDGRYEININDINKVFNLNLPKNATTKDLEPYTEMVQQYLLEHSSFSSKFGKHKVSFKDIGILQVGYGNYAQYNFKLGNTQNLPKALDVFYNGVFHVDRTHRAFLTVEQNWKDGVINNEAIISLYFTPDKPNDTLFLDDLTVWKGFVAMIKQGIWHIWIGLDHILFLVALILPAVLRRRRDSEITLSRQNFFGWEPVQEFKPAFFYILKIISFFTIAHTITLTLATLQIVTIPGRIVESIIAFSIGLTAYHNIRPIFKGKDWIIAFVFGLFHGFGFASVLSDLGLINEYLTWSLLGFNVGVEIGQVLIIAMIFPILFFLRNKKVYRQLFFFGCIFLVIVSIYWMLERVFDINFGVEQYIKKQLYDLAVSLGLK